MSQHINAIFKDFYKTRYYILLSAILFMTGMYIGYESVVFHNYLQGQIEGLADIAGGLFELEYAELWVFLFIFLNNTIKSILIIYLGVIFGILPIMFLLLNGMILGYLYLQTVVVHETATIGDLFIGIAPHGIIELPVVIIACAYGIRMGTIVMKSVLSIFSTKIRKKGEMAAFLRSTLPLLLFITITLLIAAAIEATITPWLMGF